MNVKEQLYEFCRTHISDRTLRIQNNILNIQESLTSETKSSAGDKHETGRAMLQLEREKLGLQLMEVEKMSTIFSRISITNRARSVILGSLIKTTKGDYFLAVSAGEYDHESRPIYCISAGTPIGQLLLGKTIGDVVNFNGDKIRISEIL